MVFGLAGMIVRVVMIHPLVIAFADSSFLIVFHTLVEAPGIL